MPEINILQLYPNELNTYGDHGNVVTLARRLEWNGYQAQTLYHHPGMKLPKQIDIVIGGGGQDAAQANVQTDILKIGEDLNKLVDASTPMVLICGTYQLFGHRFVTNTGQEVKGIGVFDLETFGSPKRLIGNIMIKSDFGTLYGFENHSGKTFLGKDQLSLGKVTRGNGNNGQDKTEGARTKNAFGTYMHGPFLPNNPSFCDEIIKLAVTNRYGEFKPKVIDDSLSDLTRSAARRRTY